MTGASGDWVECDKPREECGVFGVFGVEGAASVAAFGIHALQHRGQEGCGIITFDGERFPRRRFMGLVGDHFSQPDLTKVMRGTSAIGHVRYSTQGASVESNLQPLFGEPRGDGFAIAHNGNLTNARTLRRELVQDGAMFESDNDTEVILHLMARLDRGSLVDRFCEAARKVDGGYAFVGLTADAMIGARDPIGLRPLVLGKRGEGWVLSSETCALDMVDAEFVRDIEAGEVVVITEAGVESLRLVPTEPLRRPRTCAFEYIYFARPDSMVDGRNVYMSRKRMGSRLAQECPRDVDIVVPVPDSGVPAALGYAQAMNLPLEYGIIRSHHVGRTFLAPGQDQRDLKVKLKHRAQPEVLAGKRVALVDDSIVRGTTSTKIVEMVKKAGARQVHFLSASPPIKHPDRFGIDMAKRDELLAAQFEDWTDIASELNADSVGYLSLEGLYEAILQEPRDPEAPQLAEHYFNGNYLARHVDADEGMDGKVVQLSLLEDVTR